jgi:hypothetical protein
MIIMKNDDMWTKNGRASDYEILCKAEEILRRLWENHIYESSRVNGEFLMDAMTAEKAVAKVKKYM